MKLTIERAAFLKPLQHAQSVVERRNAIPILSNVLIAAESGGLSITASDMDTNIVETVAAEVEQDGRITAPAQTLYDIVRKLPEGQQIRLESIGDSGRLALRSGRSSFGLATLPVEDFPALASDDLPFRFSLPGAELKRLLDRTYFAISTEETRYYLNGIFLHAAQSDDVDVLRAVATDGHRLARVEMPLPDGAAGMPGVIVPRKVVNELRRLLEDPGAAVEIGLSETKVQFAVGPLVLTSKLIDGTFPDYERVIPANNDKIMEVDCRSFTEAVDRVATISTERSRAIKLSLQNGSLVLSATSPENGTATEEIAVSYDNAGLDVGFNSRYLLDITQQIEGEGAQFSLSDPASPTVVRDIADPSALYVLMPMRV